MLEWNVEVRCHSRMSESTVGIECQIPNVEVTSPNRMLKSYVRIECHSRIPEACVGVQCQYRMSENVGVRSQSLLPK